MKCNEERKYMDMIEFFIEMVTSGKGDCYIINIKNDDKIVRILVDGGSERKENHIDLYQNLKDVIINNTNTFYNKVNGIVVTHIDDDHLGGILKLLNDEKVKEYIDLSQDFFVIFNDFIDPATISYKQGIRLKQAIDNIPNIKLIRSYLSNQMLKINGFNIYLNVDNNIKSINEQNLNEDIFINLLLPNKEILKRLMKKWRDDIIDARLTNKSSIVFILRYNNKNILLTGDAYFRDIIDKLETIDIINKIDVIKLSHHGTDKNNNGICKIIKQYECSKIMLLTNNASGNLSLKLIKDVNEIEGMEIYCPYDIPNISIKDKEKIII